MLTFKRIIRGIEWRVYRAIGAKRKLANYMYKCTFGRSINWENPQDLNQWINWLEFKSDVSTWPMLADKYCVRDYVESLGFSNCLVPLLAKFESISDLDVKQLPPPIVLKSNNGCGDIKIVRNIDDNTNKELQKHFAPFFYKKYGNETAEPHYTYIKPCIIAEQFLDANLQDVPSESLIDYKFWCFNGKPYCCFVCSDRSKAHFAIDLYSADENWARIEAGNLIYDSHHIKATKPMPRPNNLKLMLDLASALSKGHPQMRVDLYEVAGKVYFGEITMTSQGGRMKYFTNSMLVKMGELCKNAYYNITEE